MVIELAGPAGGGKTSVLAALRRRVPDMQALPRIDRASYVRDCPRLMSTFLGMHWPPHMPRRKEMKRMLYLTTLHRRVAARSHPALAFDEGPVYMLTRLLAVGDAPMTNPAFLRWWRHTLRQWAATLQLIVVLDAENECLVERIRRRPGPPPIPDLDDRALFPFLSRYRAGFARVIGELTRDGGPAVLRLDSGRVNVETLAERVQEACHLPA